MNTNTQEVREYIDLAMKCTRHFHPVEWEIPEKRKELFNNKILYLKCAVEYYHKGMTVSEMKKVLRKWVFKNEQRGQED